MGNKARIVGAEQGSVVLEGILSVLLLCLALVSSLELVRRSHVERLLHHGAFLAVRAQVFQGSPSRAARAFWRAALPTAHRSWIARTELKISRRESGFLAITYTRFTSWLRFPVPRGQKRAFEVTRQCRFASPQ